MELALEGPVADPAAAWARIADPEPFLRAAGLPPIELSATPDEDGEVTLRVRLLGPVGLRHEAEEVDAGWVVGARLWFGWTVRGPVLATVRFEAELVPEADGVRPRVRLAVETWTGLVAPFVGWGLRMARRAWQRRLDALPAPGAAAAPGDARHLDLSTEAALARWADRQGDPALVGRVRRLLTGSPAWALDRLCPRQLARRWDLDEDRVLDGLVGAVAAGVLGVGWQVHCARCDALVASVPALSAMPASAVCARCRTPVPLDLCDTVSAVLTVPLLVRPHEERYAADTPAREPAVWAAVLLGRGGAQTVPAPAPGRWRIVGGTDCDDTVLEVRSDDSDAAAAPLRWTPGAAPLQAVAGQPLALAGGPRRRHRVRIVAADAQTRRLPALRVLSHPGWRRVLGRPGLAPRVVAEVHDVTVLYTDLTHTRAFYASAGDREALRFVQAHLRQVEAGIEAGGGVVVKTLGDGVMAAFADPAAGVRAALVLLDDFDAWCRGRGVAAAPELRAGISRGHALAMHTDAARLDLFGGTVNAAARAVYGTAAGTLGWTAAVAADPRCQACVDAHNAHHRVRSAPGPAAEVPGQSPGG